MICFFDTSTDPYENLATEEFLLKERQEPIFRIWRNRPAVIVGRFQNTVAEINGDYIREHRIPVVRRLSGGGAVFHDLGNINYTFIDKKIAGEDTSAMFRRFTRPIIEALNQLGVKAYLEGRNDLLIDGRKFSGNAICVHSDRVLQHGTLLFSSSMSNLAKALNPRPEKYISKGIKSNVSRVTNISEHLPEDLQHTLTAESFMQYLHDFVLKENGLEGAYSPSEKEAIRCLRDRKYALDEWNYGQSPSYAFSEIFQLSAGFVQVDFEVEKGIISQCKITGDYFLTRPVEAIEAALTGTPQRTEDIRERLQKEIY